MANIRLELYIYINIVEHFETRYEDPKVRRLKQKVYKGIRYLLEREYGEWNFAQDCVDKVACLNGPPHKVTKKCYLLWENFGKYIYEFVEFQNQVFQSRG